ncbi:outer membrane beta-barrel family protein [Tenacibaculum tangerinum]|uniref:Outer membrane beta-barrel family protein n=1 Tax=Tenacibaculum tangerinum TaxID=3038772 RepID=A0ABY8L667_9FLAO|nr:outer membrane beta-barrel family protein [Tenacibaculum tangerinum]WGH76884.1 outer membrane beta-barrel family protein [Tenacibaculum tangerinum]
MKKYFTAFCLSLQIFCFSQVTLTGKVLNTNNEPIELADAVLIDYNKKIIAGVTTNDMGEFKLEVKTGVYTLKVSFLGYKIWNKIVDLTSDKEEIIHLLEDSTKLDEVQIETSNRTFSRSADRLIFDVKNSLIGKANGDMTELLNFTPSVIVEGESIQVLGKDGVRVLVNGRDLKLSGSSLTAFLRSLKASDIDSIELIQNPPAKYEAEGDIAIINILTKKKEVEFWNSNITGAYRQGYYGIASYNGAFNYNKKKFSFSTNVAGADGFSRGEEKNEIFYPDNFWNQETYYKYQTKYITTNISSEYRISSHLLVGAQYTGSFSEPNSTNNGNIRIQEKAQANNVTEVNNIGEEEGDKQFNAANFHAVINLTPKRVINIDFDYFDYERDQKSVVNSFFSPSGDESSISNSSLQNVSNFSSKIDVEYPFKNVSLNFGSKLSFSETNNHVFITGVVNFDQQSSFNYKEDVQALYASLSSSLGLSEWSFQSGLRMERTETFAKENMLGSEVKNDYVNFFPSIYINYKPNQLHNLSLNYSKRILRPRFDALNPFRIYTSPFSYSEGNPNLQPVLLTNIGLSHLYKNFLNTEIYFSQTKNGSGQVAVLDEDNLTQSITRLNYFDSYDVGLWVNYLYNKKKWWQSLNTFHIYYNESTSKIYPLTPKSVNGVVGILKTTNHFSIDKNNKTTIGFDFSYRFPNTSKELIYNYEQYILNAFVKYNVNNNLQMSLNANNILREYNFNNKSTRNQIEAIYKGYYDTQYVKFSINYNFGNKKVRRTNRKLGNKDEKNRT